MKSQKHNAKLQNATNAATLTSGGNELKYLYIYIITKWHQETQNNFNQNNFRTQENLEKCQSGFCHKIS